MANSWLNNFIASLTERKNTKPTLSEQDKMQRCIDILTYWLDVEFFDLPECTLEKDKEDSSFAVDHFDQELSSLNATLMQDPDAITDNSRLTIMFQCHRAGYIKNDEISKKSAKDNDYSTNPNKQIPRTFLLAHKFIPIWNAETQQLTWKLSAENADMIVNSATIRIIFRHCPPEAANNQRFSQWISGRKEELENLFYAQFKDTPESGLTTAELKTKLAQVNRQVARIFWPDKNAQDFMQRYCATVDANYAEPSKEDEPVFFKDENVLTFRWRFNFQKDPQDNKQLGPFFADDLELCLTQLYQGTVGLSKPLQRYLLGCTEQKLLPEARDNGDIYHPLTQEIPLGRWVSNPKYGLSLMQSVAVNVALSPNEPIVAVNGPPGTGKTTLLKDIIATHFVLRTIRLAELAKKEDWFETKDVQEMILSHSMIVASSNNKAVENISKELPAKSEDSHHFQLSHFAQVAPKGDWGLFCAVLGNSSNRNKFKGQLQKLQDYLKYSDIFGLNRLVSLLKRKNREEIAEKFKITLMDWKNLKQIPDLIADIEVCPASKKYAEFFSKFNQALIAIEQDKLSIDRFIEAINQYNDEQLEGLLQAIHDFKKQWFAKELFRIHHKNKLNKALARFEQAKRNLLIGLTADRHAKLDHWQMEELTQLTSPSAYQQMETALQLKSPYSNEALNQARSELFAACMQLNEALLTQSAARFDAKIWQDLQDLLDGTLQSNETQPYHAKLWALLFLFFPVVSTSLSSVENQFKLMKERGGFGIGIIDEAGQAVNYHVVGLMQRCQQMILVGDPIQLEPVVGIPYDIDFAVAAEYLPISQQYDEQAWGDRYVVSTSSAQSIADLAGRYMSKIGDRQVGIPLYVHRRCLEPMFGIANKIAYDNKMVNANPPLAKPAAITSGWINIVEEKAEEKAYYNKTEAKAAIDVIEHLAKTAPEMLEGGLFIITPFTQMKQALANEWRARVRQGNYELLQLAFGKAQAHKPILDFANDNIGTVHTFQGKEASTVLLCMAASDIRNKMGGVKWVNSKPNLINVAVTRAKKHLFVLGNAQDWSNGALSADLQSENMQLYGSLEDFYRGKVTEQPQCQNEAKKVEFDFGI